MELIPLVCNQCGAKLDAPINIHFVTCQHCSTTLAIKRNDSTIYTEKIDAISEKLDELTKETRRAKLRSKLESLERDWERTREQYKYRREDGSTFDVSSGTGIVGTVIGSIVILLFIIFSSNRGSSFPFNGLNSFTVIGVVALVVVIGQGFYFYHKAMDYQNDLRRYQQARQKLRLEFKDVADDD